MMKPRKPSERFRVAIVLPKSKKEVARLNYWDRQMCHSRALCTRKDRALSREEQLVMLAFDAGFKTGAQEKLAELREVLGLTGDL